MFEIFLGRSYIITTSKSLTNILESLVQKFQLGVVINFEKIGGPDKPPEGKYAISAVSQCCVNHFFFQTCFMMSDRSDAKYM